ncbi:E3 ubiquitin-protein ligase FANCL isoform X1 [Drosophila albomicans]|uniref:E3 ubiquitin-protein ligase FANCL isoform X1 n=2 Tax=Drosophila albomicans TaxID=7291 RepID=A0A6P8XK36_DROAB|nr:E3 ubiquitin-protein ligase FANCL isoform X1 [Drosophila albomicans]
MFCEKNNDLRDLVAKHPGLQVKHIKNKAYVISGVVFINEKWLRLKLYLPHFPELRDFQVHLQQQLEYKLYNHANLKVQSDSSLEDLLVQLAKMLPAPTVVDNAQSKQQNIYAEILNLHKPQEYRLQLDDRCSRIRFSNFADYDAHYLELELPSLRPLEHSLPDCVSLGEMLATSARSLGDALALYLRLLDELRPFYDSLADIDELCDVLEPSPITTKHNSRVFPLKDRVYLKLTIADPFASYGSMALQIIGPTEEVAQLRHVLSDGLGSWDMELDMHKNLLRIFDLCYFPMRGDLGQMQAASEEEQHCNICYVYRLDTGEVPLVSCDNSRCVLKCHAVCLKEWFDTLIDGKTFLEVSFGLCPFCKAKLSTSFAALLKT